jgi:hypothetical protein
VDVRNRSVKTFQKVDQAGGVAVGDAGVVYMTSLSQDEVAVVELSSEATTLYSGSGGDAGAVAWSEGLQAMFAIRPSGESGLADVLTMTLERTPTSFVLVSDEIGKTLVSPLGPVVDGSGRRVLIAASGDELTPSGLTMVASRRGSFPVSSNVKYPSDPDDTYMEPMSEVVLRRRYRPRSAAIVYGR